MNRLRGERVLVELEERGKQEAFKVVNGIHMPSDNTEELALTEGTVKMIGTEVNQRDISPGMKVFVKKHQGERLSPKTMEYLYNLREIIGTE